MRRSLRARTPRGRPGRASLAPPVVTFTTDFGARDPWVGIMKGVVAGIAGAVQLIDVTHEIARHDVLEAALALEAAAPFFPDGTVHVAVVDPGVGSARRGLALSAGTQQFVGPDNGIFTAFLESRGWRAVELAEAKFQAREVSRTFHGRDVFAPAAAYLALGTPLDQLGPMVSAPRRLPWPEASRGDRGVTGEVVHVDRFGNLVTSIPVEAVVEGAVVEVGAHELRLVTTYADLEPGAAAALIGSTRRLEVVVGEGSAAETLGVTRGAGVVVRPRSG